MKETNVFEKIQENAVDIFSEESLLALLKEKRPLKIKLGADPSRADLHLGHTVPLRMLRYMQDMGHEIIFVIGDFTGMIGDPSGRSKTRVPLSFEEVRENGETYMAQVGKIIDTAKAKVLYNSIWLSKMNFADVLSLAGKYTLARILERDDFKTRFRENHPIGLHELLYPLMQGYDSVALDADIEIGGTDQTFNLLVGRELQKDYGQTPQVVITFPLLPGLDGKEKMSKSLDNYIGIDEPAEIMFEKCMKVPDALLATYFQLTTDLGREIYIPCIEKDIREAHFLYAQEIVKMYHGQPASIAAKERYLMIAAGNVPQDLPTLHISEAEVTLIDLLKRAGFAASNGEARRLITGKGIKVNGTTVTDTYAVIQEDIILSRGKNKFIRIVFQA
ncbi:MAG: tyrosine--tRNA ligase [Christensenellaceae bacterium]